MADEEVKAQEPDEQAEEPEPEQAEGDEGVKDSHGQAGINKERHDKEVAALQAEIAKLKGEAAEAAEAKAKREEYEQKFAALEAKMADTERTHSLEMAGCRNVKAAKALLDDYAGDVGKLKEACPYLFGEERKTGSTGGKPTGPSSDIDEKLDKAFGLKK